jgi:superfamily II DNA/RNA helicase
VWAPALSSLGPQRLLRPHAERSMHQNTTHNSLPQMDAAPDAAKKRVIVEGTDLPLKMPVASLEELKLPAEVVANRGEQTPTLLESYTGPIVMAGRDMVLVGALPTGGEQVAPLLLPLVGRLLEGSGDAGTKDAAQAPPGGGPCAPRALLLAPTRPLATYAAGLATSLSAGTGLRCARACGGTTIEASVAECAGGLELLIATPGRLLDLIDRGAVSLGAVKILTIVGADLLFDSGFEDQLRRIIVDEGMAGLQERQTVLSCAALSPSVARVSSHLLRTSSVKLTAPLPWLAVASAPLLRQAVCFAEEDGKQPALAALIAAHGSPPSAPPGGVGGGASGAVSTAATTGGGGAGGDVAGGGGGGGGGGGAGGGGGGSTAGGGGEASPTRAVGSASAASRKVEQGGGGKGLTLVVVSSRRQCEILLYYLRGEGFAASALTQERPKRAEKETVLSTFSSAATRVLVITDAALRALGEELCPIGHVISYDFPSTMEEYASRLRHTAQGGHTGRVTTMINDSVPRQQAEALTSLLQRTGNDVPRWLEGMATATVATPLAQVS